MNGSLSDAIGVLAAALLAIPLVVLPGYALGLATGVTGFRGLAPGRRILRAALLGVGLMPFLDSAAAAAAGLGAATALNLVLALAALRPALATWRGRVDGPACALMALWTAVVAYALVDVDTGAALHQPFAVFDLVKHAALTRAIVESGVPPLDPFFARPERVSYYYYFYTLCALVDRLGGVWVDGRTAFAGLAIWTGVALVGLLDALLSAAGLPAGRGGAGGRRAILLLLPAGSLDILLVAKFRLTEGIWVPAPEWLNEQVLWWPGSLVWVPHHVAAALAGWLGLLALAEAADGGRPGRAAEASAVGVAGLAFAACAGLSVWVCLGIAAAAGLWLGLLAAERRWRDAGRLAAAGALSLALSAPYLRGVLENRDGSGGAIVFGIRTFMPLEGLAPEPLMSLVRLLMMPLSYFVGFGVFALGALLFWRLVPRAEAHAREAGRLLTLCAAASLLVGGFLRSAIIYNDLGWRVVLVAQVSAFVWSAAALARLAATAPAERPAGLPRAGFVAAMLAAGYATTLYAFGAARAYPLSTLPSVAYVNAHRGLDRDLREAYRWAGAHLPPGLVLQHDPDQRRSFDFGLYGRQPVAVADRDARLFGAAPEAVAARLAAVLPIFAADLPGEALRRRAAGAGIGALVVTAGDPVWRDPGSWVWRARPAYAGPRVRIVRVEDLDG